MLSASSCDSDGDGDQEQTYLENSTILTVRQFMREELIALIRSPSFLSELAAKLLDWQRPVNEEPMPEYIKSYNLCVIGESIAKLAKKNKELSEEIEQTDKRIGQLKVRIEELSLEVQNMVERGPLVQLPANIPSCQVVGSQDTFIERGPLLQLPTNIPSCQVVESQDTFTRINEAECECDVKKSQLYNNLLYKFQRNLLNTSPSKRPSQLLISETVTKLLPNSVPIVPLNMTCVWDVPSSFNSLTETIAE